MAASLLYQYNYLDY